MKNTGTSSINTAYLLLMSLTAALGGFLFGYDWVVIGVQNLFMKLISISVTYPLCRDG